MPNHHPPSNYSYIVGEDEDRLAETAEYFGLQQARQPRFYGASFFDAGSTLTAARMHSVGALGSDERVDATGTIHLISLRRRRKFEERTNSYEKLSDLFVAPGAEGTTTSTVKEEENEEEEDDGEDIFEEEDVVEGGSLQAAVFGIIKGTVGPAILYLPQGFQTSGYGVAIPAMLVATALYIYNANLLLDCWKVESDRNKRVEQRLSQLSALLVERSPARYGSTMTDATTIPDPYVSNLLTYPELAKRALGPYSILVKLGIASLQFGVCLTYFIFVPKNLYECSKALSGGKSALSTEFFLLVMVMMEIPLSWIRDIRKLTPTNVLATFLIAYGLVMVLVLAVMEGSQRVGDGTSLVFVENLQNLPVTTDSWFLFVGTSFFMMEGSITLLVPLQEAVYLDEEKSLFPKMNQIVTMYTVTFYIFFSMVCCAAFGNDIQTALTASLPESTLATTIQLAYSLAVILTFPLQAFPALQVVFQIILPEKKQMGSNNDSAGENFLLRNLYATLIVCALGILAFCTIDYLGNVVSILGSLFGIPLALIFPPLMHNTLLQKTISSKQRAFNNVVMMMGVVAIGASSFATIAMWNKGGE